MIPLFRSSIPIPKEKPLPDLKVQLRIASGWETSEGKNYLTLARERIVPKRGLFRLLIPQVYAKVRIKEGVLSYWLKLDGVGTFLAFIVFGGLLVEIFMDRERFPREYPIEMLYAIGAGFIVLVGLEIFMTNKRLKKLVQAKIEKEHIPF